MTSAQPHGAPLAAGLDIGGSKIEAQVFEDHWRQVARRRIETPASYEGLLGAVCDLLGWVHLQTKSAVPVGICAPGLVHPQTGCVFAANLAAAGHPFPTDIAQRAGRPIAYLNDCRAMALSEAVFGSGKGAHRVLSVILGTGVSSGWTEGGRLILGPTATLGEVGHTAAPAHLVEAHGLPIQTCGCGRMGCIETYVSGPGLVRLAAQMTGHTMTAPDVANRRGGDMAAVWAVWCALVANLLQRLVVTLDPDVIVLGGGLSQIDGVIDDLTQALTDAQIGGFPTPPLQSAQGGDATGARGAAFAAWQEVQP